MKTTCDVCKVGSDDLGFDDVHKGLNSPSWLYAFLCRECRAVNDAFWALSGVKYHAEMEIQMMKRAFRRMKSA